MSAATHNIQIEQGAHFEIEITVQDNQTTPAPIDLTGYAFEGQLRLSVDAKNHAAAFSFTILDQSIPANLGKVIAYIPAATTALIPVKSSVEGVRPSVNFLYDISYGPTGGNKYRLLQGTATVSAEVTR